MARVQTQVQAVAVNKHLARVQMAGEFATHLGGSKRTVETTQRGIAEHTISEIVVLGIDSQGNAVMDHTFEVDHASHEGDVLINSAEGISMLQAVRRHIIWNS